MPDLPATFLAAMEAERDSFNARFTARTRAGIRIDGAAFLQHLEQTVAPLVSVVHDVLPERSQRIVSPLFDLSLDLFAAAQLGSEARSPWVHRVWDELLPATGNLLAREPRKVAGCLSNAIIQIVSQRGTKPQQWLDRMRQIVRHCQSVNELLNGGVVAAWQAGLVQYRQAALDVAKSLRGPLAAIALGVKDLADPQAVRMLIDKVQAHRWLTVEAVEHTGQKLEIACAAVTGAFTGFGGEFIRPPSVRCEDDRLWVTDGKSEWELQSDAYGCWFRRCGEALSKPLQKPIHSEIGLDHRGNIRWGMLTLAQPHLAGASSYAATSQTLAVTIPTSHHVFLYSVPGAPA